jgi:hypothetical protein
LSHRNGRLVTVPSKLENSTVSLNAFCNACAKIAWCTSDSTPTFPYAGSSNQNASERFVLCSHSPDVWKLRCPSNPTNKNLTQLGLEIQKALSRFQFKIWHALLSNFSSWPTRLPPKILIFPPESCHIYIYIYRVIKILCTPDYYNTLDYLDQSDCLAADRQGQGDTRLTLTPFVFPISYYVIMVSDWNCLKYICLFFVL